MDATREFTWGGGGAGEVEGGRYPTRAVLVVGGLRGRQPQRGVYRALSGVTFQDLDIYMRQASSCNEPALPTEEDEGLDSLDSHAHTLTPSPDPAQRVVGAPDQPGHAEGGYFSLERCLSEEDAAHLHDSLENLMQDHPPQPSVHHRFPPNYHDPYQNYQQHHEVASQGYGPMPTYVNPTFQHQPTYVSPQQCHEYSAGDRTYLPVGRNYPNNSGNFPSESEYSPNIIYHQRENYPAVEDAVGRGMYDHQARDVYPAHASYPPRDTYQPNYLYPNYQKGHPPQPQDSLDKEGEAVRKASVLSADSLEDLPQSPTSPVSPQLPVESRKTFCYKDSLEDVRPRLVSELREFFERRKSTTSTSSPESESLQESKIEEEEEEPQDSDNQKSMASAEVQVDLDTSVDSDRNTSVISDKTDETSSTTEDVAEAPQESSDDPTKDIYEESDVVSPRLGDVAFLRVTQDTTQTLLASTRLVQATLKPATKATTFFISLGSKFMAPNFEKSKRKVEEKERDRNTGVKEDLISSSEDSKDGQSSSEVTEEEMLHCTDSSDPAEYQESRLILRHFVSNWESESPPPDDDSDIDEFFLVLDSTGGKGNFSFPSGSSSMISSVGSSSSDQKSDTNNSNDQDSYDDGNLADIGEPDTTSSSGLSPVIESTTDESSRQTPDVLETPDEKDGFLDAPPHNVIVKPFLGLGKGSARESHAGSVLGIKQTRVVGLDRLLPIYEEPSQSSQEFETITDTVFCGSDDGRYHVDHNGNTTSTLLTPELTNPPPAAAAAPAAAADTASVSSPSSDNGGSCETLQCIDEEVATPVGSRETICFLSEPGKKVASHTMQVGVAPVHDELHQGQSLDVSALMSSHRRTPHPPGNHANLRYICENEVTCDSGWGAGGEAAADPLLTAHTAAAALATCTFSFSVEDRTTPDLEALATLIAERIMSGSLPSTSASGSVGTSAHLAGVTESATLTCDEVIVSGSVAVSTGRGSDQPLHSHSHSSAPAPPTCSSHVKKGESEVTLGPVINMNSDVLRQLVADASSDKWAGEDECCGPLSEESDNVVRVNQESDMSDPASDSSSLAQSSSRGGCQTVCDEVVRCDNITPEIAEKVEYHQCVLSRQSSITSDMGDETPTDVDALCSTDSCVVKPGYSPESECILKTLQHGAPRPVFPRKDSKGSTCESLWSRKTSVSSTVTTPDDDAMDTSPGDMCDRRLSTSSGVSSLSEHSARKFSSSSGVSSVSDDWDWFPGRRKSFKGQLGLSEYRTVSTTGFCERGELRKMSNASAASTHSSGVSSLAGSVCESGLNEGRKLSFSSGISCLSKIKEETKSISDVDLNKPESFEEDHTLSSRGPTTKETCHNTTLDGKRLSLPPPVWPRGAQQDLAHTTCEVIPSLSGLKSWDFNLGSEAPEFLVKRAEILKSTSSASRANLKLDLPLICPSSCPLRRKDYIGDHDCGYLHGHTTSENDSKGKRNSVPFEPKRIKAKPKMSSRLRRLTLHTFENIAEQWRRQQGMNEETEYKAESIDDLRFTEPLPEDISEEIEFRRDLVRDLEKLEAEIEAEVQALESESSHSKEEEDSTSMAAVFDSNESVLSAGSFSRTGSGNLCGEADTSMDIDTDAVDASKEAVGVSGPHFDALCPSVDQEETSEGQSHAQDSEDSQNKGNSREMTAESGPFSPLSNSKSLPSLTDSEEAKVLDTTSPSDAVDTRKTNITSAKSVVTRDSTAEIVPCSNYEFSEMAFPAMINFDELEEQEAIENFSDEDLVLGADFEAFSETEHDTDMDNLNFELFEPHIKGDKIDGKMLSKRQKKLRKLRRKFSFSSAEKQPKDIKGTITSSLKRFKNAKHRIEKLMHRTLRSEAAPSHSSGESLEGSPLSQSSGHQAAHTTTSSSSTRGPLERSDSHSSKTSESQISLSLDRAVCRTWEQSGCVGGVSRNTSRSSDDHSSLGPWDSRPHDGDESTYSWSDADSDFEYVPMEPCKTMMMCKEICDNSNNESVEACTSPHSPRARPAAVQLVPPGLVPLVPTASGSKGKSCFPYFT